MTSGEAMAAKAAKALRKAATEHKRAQAHHRRGAQQCMRALAELRAECAALGIKLEAGADPEEGSWPRKR